MSIKMQHPIILKLRRYVDVWGLVNCVKNKSSSIMLVLTIIVCLFVLYNDPIFADLKLPTLSISFDRANGPFSSGESDTTAAESKADEATTESTTGLPEIWVDMDSFNPSFKIATRNGTAPSMSEAEAAILERMHMCEKCQADQTKNVVDIGAHLGQFGLYASACKCSVSMFEGGTDYVKLIKSSIDVNDFDKSRNIVYNNLVGYVALKNNGEFPIDENEDTANAPDAPKLRIGEMKWPPAIFLFRFIFGRYDMEALRSAEVLFLQKRIHNLLVLYNSVTNSQDVRKQLLDYVCSYLKPRFIFIFHPNEEKLYGPLNLGNLRNLHEQQDSKRPVIGLLAIFDENTSRVSMRSEPFIRKKFFS